MGNKIQIRQMTEEDIDIIYRVFSDHNIRKSWDYISKCWEENKTGERITLLAFYEGKSIKTDNKFI
jgi:hypothetical protein